MAGASAVFTANVPNNHADIRVPYQGVQMNQALALFLDESMPGPECDVNVGGAESLDEALARFLSSQTSSL
jgi:hypothetical protein